MGIKQDIDKSLRRLEIIKINDQPTNKDMNQLNCELRAMLATILIANGVINHRHIGMILVQTEYTVFSSGTTKFVAPTNPGPFPTTGSTDKVKRLHQITEQKHLII